MVNRDFSVDIDEDIDVDVDEIGDIENVVEGADPDRAMFMAYLAGYTKGVSDKKDGKKLPFDDTEGFKKHVADGYEKYRKREGIYSPES